jgi:DNA replication factor GINS
MDVAELQSARNRERRTDSLQSLPDSFYDDAAAFVRELRARRTEVAAAADDPFDSKEVNRLTDSIKTAENTVEAIYERRVGKVVKLASLDAAGMSTDDEGLTPEEQDLFGTLVAAIQRNREVVIDGLGTVDTGADTDADANTETDAEADIDVGSEVDPESERAAGNATESGAGPSGSPSDPPGATANGGTADTAADGTTTDSTAADGAGSETSAPAPPPPAEGNADAMSAADVMGAPAGTAGSAADADPVGNGASASTDVGADGDAEAVGVDGSVAKPDHTAGATGLAGEADQASEIDKTGGIDRQTLRITRDVGEIVGIDERVYDLASEDVVTLPAANAKPLVDRNAAERLE